MCWGWVGGCRPLISEAACAKSLELRREKTAADCRTPSCRTNATFSRPFLLHKRWNWSELLVLSFAWTTSKKDRDGGGGSEERKDSETGKDRQRERERERTRTRERMTENGIDKSLPHIGLPRTMSRVVMIPPLRSAVGTHGPLGPVLS